MNRIRRFASISKDERYRWRLSRQWGEGPQVLFIMLNPSTADSKTDTPTIRRCIDFAHSWGFVGIQVVNLFAYRSPDPRLLDLVKDPIGPANNQYITSTADQFWPRVVAWGPRAPQYRVDEVLELLGHRDLSCLGTTGSGAPIHPLYARPNAQLMPWPVNPTIPEVLP